MASPSLSELYTHLSQAAARRDARAARASFYQLIGLRPRAREEAPPAALPTALPARTASLLRYFQPRLIDRHALLGGARQVVKFEDLGLTAAAALARELGLRGLKVVRTGPYSKRFDVTTTAEASARPLYNVIASWGTQAEQVAEAEQEQSLEGARRAGLALGYPACCVEHFVEVERRARATRDSVNELALRSPRGQGQDAPWPSHLLSNLSPIGFVPCSLGCPEALGFAARVLGAVERRAPEGRQLIERALRRPLLFFRYPLFYALDGVATEREGARGVRYAAALPNDDGLETPPALRALAHDELGRVLAAGDELTLDAGALSVYGQGALLARWEVERPGVALLLRFTDAPAVCRR